MWCAILGLNQSLTGTVYGPRGGVGDAGPGAPGTGVCAGRLPAVLRSGGGLVALLGAVDGGASDPEQVGQFGGAVLTGLEQADQMCFREKVKWRTGSEGRINHIKRS